MKKKILLILIFVFLVILLGATYIYFNNKKTENNTDPFMGYYYDLTDNASIDNLEDITKYNDKIIDTDTKEYDYKLIFDDSVLYGKVYIDDDGYLNITNSFSKKNLVISNDKFKSIYKNYVYTTKLIFYAVDENDLLYKIILNTSDINDIKIYQLSLKNKISKFTSIIYNVVGSEDISPIVLCDDNKLYVADTGLLYSKDYYELFDNYLIFNDKSIASQTGKLLKNLDGSIFKIQGYVVFNEKVFGNDPKIAIITEDGYFMFIISDEKFLVGNKGVKNISYQDDKIKIEFTDNFNLEFNGYYQSIDE